MSNKYIIFFADDWIQTADLWYWKRPLYQLSHNHCPPHHSCNCSKVADDRLSHKGLYLMFSADCVQCDQIWQFFGLWATF